MNSNRFARLLFAALAAAALTLGVSTAPASAAVVDTDPVRVTSPGAAFGAGAIVAGVPGFGQVVWDSTAGVNTPSAVGTLYIAAPGTCARVRLESYDGVHAFITGRNGATRCATVGGVNQWPVNLSNTGDPLSTHVHVEIQFLSAAGVWTPANFSIANLF